MNLTIKNALRQAAQIFAANNIADARHNANLLLKFVLNKDLTFLIAHDDDVLTEDEDRLFWQLVERRKNGEPPQYITGTQEFYGLDFIVRQGVLIPRPETEILVEIAVEKLQNQSNKTFCDVGTGSGCISVAILKNVADANAVALDISPLALQIAAENAVKHQISNRIIFQQSDVFDYSSFIIPHSSFGLILSNPPYISSRDLPDLQREVREFEPHGALFSGADGFDVIRKLLVQSPDFLIENGFLIFEIGFGQAAQIENLIDKNVWNLLEIRRDLQGIERIVVLQKKC